MRIKICFILGIFGIVTTLTLASNQKSVFPTGGDKNDPGYFLKIAKEKNPEIALKILQDVVINDSYVGKNCYSLTREIGREAYIKYADFDKALSYDNGICNGGYLHGVAAEYSILNKDRLNQIDELCRSETNKIITLSCGHAFGHGLMVNNNYDLVKTIKECRENFGKENEEKCINGSFMELFVDAALNGSEYLKNEDLLFPCNDDRIVENNTKADCYMYEPIYSLSKNANNYAESIKLCDTIPVTAQIKYCVSGVGSVLVSTEITKADKVVKICGNQPAKVLRDSCFFGAGWQFASMTNSVNDAKTYCQIFEGLNRKSCDGAVDDYEKQQVN